MQAPRIAVDIGGTFTDFALELGCEDAGVFTAKTSTTPGNPVDGVLAGIGLALDAARVTPQEVQSIIHGTTLATNALIERKGSRRPSLPESKASRCACCTATPTRRMSFASVIGSTRCIPSSRSAFPAK